MRLDEIAWARYKHSLAKKSEREHIVSVQHGKSQNVIGRGSLNPSFGKCFSVFFAFSFLFFVFFEVLFIMFRQNILILTVIDRLVEKYMERNCPVNLLPDITLVPNVEAWLKVAAIEQKACESKDYYIEGGG